jgi:menaquinone-dependent protoporphyrinogen oxidase
VSRFKFQTALEPMPSTLIAYSTTDGQTLSICERIRQRLEAVGTTVQLFDIGSGKTCDLGLFDTVVIGASIRYGKHRPELYRFIDAHREALDLKPNAFFSVNVVARKPGKDTPESNPYVRAFSRQTTWNPKLMAVFAGKIDYPRYTYLDRQVIRFIMWLTHGPTDATSTTEFTDWQAVHRFAQSVATLADPFGPSGRMAQRV